MMSHVDHDYYSLIARAVEALHINVRETRLTLYERARKAQLSSFDPAIPEAEIRHERTALEQAIHAVEIKAAAADVEQAKRDAKIVTDYAVFMAETQTRSDCFYDASELPHPKEAIIAAIEREIVRSPHEELIEVLESAGAFMWNFLDGIGPNPWPIESISQRPQDNTPADGDELRRIGASVEYIRSIRSASLMDTAKKEDKKVEERIAAAINIRREVRGE